MCFSAKSPCPADTFALGSIGNVKTIVDLGAELATRRQAFEKSQAEVAAAAGLRQDMLSRLERGRLPDVSVSKLLRVAHSLGLELTLAPPAQERPTLDTLREERSQGVNTGPIAR